MYDAAPGLFAFVWKKAPDNAAPVGVATRGAPVRQRNATHQTAKKGRELFSAPVPFSHTCELNGARPRRAIRKVCPARRRQPCAA